MNKELEEFKKETLVKLKDIKRKSKLDAGEYMLDSLMQELKPKPEFIRGETVLVSDDGEEWESAVFEYIDNTVNYNFFCSSLKWKFCKKIEALSMNMTDHDGSDKYPNNVGRDTLVYVLRNNGNYYDGGAAHEFEWNRIAKFQILKDLIPR